MMCDSNTRAAYSELLVAFGQVFGGNHKVELYIKDRWATEQFKMMVQAVAKHYDITVIHDDTHITDKGIECARYNTLDCHIFLNRTSTFALTVAQGMAVGLPTIVMDYSGPRDYCNSLNACLVKYQMEDVTEQRLSDLVQRGYRNYLLAHPSMFKRTPQWAQPSIDSIKECLLKVYEDKAYRDNIAYNARATAEGMTWQRAALNLACIVNK
jgi:glycosyltransferase involved in cell wall biosynthesis